jgi:hypothetical protein
MMYGILVYKEAEWERAAEESSLAFNAVLRNHAHDTLSIGDFMEWEQTPRADMQMRLLCTEDFAKWFPTTEPDYKLALVQYAGAALTNLPPLVVASYLGKEFVNCCPRTEISRMQLITKIRMDTYDDGWYSELRAMGKMSPHLAIMGMPLAMAYYRQGEALRKADFFCAHNGDIASIVCPLRGDFWDRMVEARNEGLAIRRSNLFEVV